MLETLEMSVLRVDVRRAFDVRYAMDFRVRYAYWHVDNPWFIVQRREYMS